MLLECEGYITEQQGKWRHFTVLRHMGRSGSVLLRCKSFERVTADPSSFPSVERLCWTYLFGVCLCHLRYSILKERQRLRHRKLVRGHRDKSFVLLRVPRQPLPSPALFSPSLEPIEEKSEAHSLPWRLPYPRCEMKENILWDNKWNQGILDCVPDAFINAFTTLVKSIVNAPVSSLPQMFRFLPITNPSHPNLKRVQDSIQAKLMNETIVPCESFTSEKLFRKPHEVYKLLPSFRSILNAAKSQHVSFSTNIVSQGAYFLTSSLDEIESSLGYHFESIVVESSEGRGFETHGQVELFGLVVLGFGFGDMDLKELGEI
ncbi:histidine kinase-like ATPase, C-terminal domain-containing protein [Artemisia annua]|uniref:Histidine kinase-like ATPase, C-terminal domain-containing protein n=1 Tax=Artemisia annua TaxID=35608 RepID=A0A2U1NI69_ARTAN|nr:histidine kinase-like ATPase, C-terminal domain-containing protein [Artemisia annua]